MSKRNLANIGFGIVLFFLMPLELRGDFVVYSFTGEVIPGSSSHSMITDGETYSASFLVDLATPNVGGDFGAFEGAVQSGEVTFSGGYVSPIDFSGFRVQVANDFLENGLLYDVARVDDGGFGFIFQTNTTDTSVLSSTELPLAGTAFSSSPTVLPAGTNLGVFRYEDDFGLIDFFVTDPTSNSSSFSASAVPEPTGFFAIAAVGIAILFRRQKS